ncbi:hypothetical protein [Treponema denticola]|uniref:Gingipain domain-containing protein n=1 Tax=Treponema denticola SP33 TaxID=999437 RepID=M2B574_TREDN|nr:hypothetical protein [Treponema denticola]EMB20017.1 hypothetical protein HMPREF9733_02573 [Treponema denticola SP33]EPF36156.1 hypothetical protein HMPREF9732_01869 [Treponema denticola SP32]
MGLIKGNTHWIFLLASSQEPEDRHIYDVIFGIVKLLHVGVCANDITVVIDTKRIGILQAFSSFQYKKIYKSIELTDIFQNNKHETIVLFANGHGNPTGLDSEPVIKPYHLFSNLQNANNLKKGIVFLGQCFAGVFNYMPVKSFEKDGKILPPLVVIGGTGLYPSISSHWVFDKPHQDTWAVNIFFYYLFQWIIDPVDIDGDGRYGLIDAYKFIGCSITDFCNYQKRIDHIKTIEEEQELAKAIELLKTETSSEKDKSALELKIQSLEQMLLLRYNHQEVWILNVFDAMDIYF